MNGNSINFDEKKYQKSDFYKKIKEIFNIDDTDIHKILVSKKEACSQKKMDLNTLLDIIIMILLDHYVKNSQK